MKHWSRKEKREKRKPFISGNDERKWRDTLKQILEQTLKQVQGEPTESEE